MQPETTAGELLEAVHWARKHGFHPIPLLTEGDFAKAPGKPDGKRLTKWQESEYPDEAWSGKANGLGFRNDTFKDVDLDCPEALLLAPHFLPETSTFGRKSTPRSHWIYNCPQLTETIQRSASFGMIIELRGGGGSQTMVPPSIHGDSGERVEWTNGKGTRATVGVDFIKLRVNHLAATAIFLHYWKDGNRDVLACCYASVMFAASVDQATAQANLDFLIKVGDTDPKDVKTLKGKVKRVYKKEGTEKIYGVPKLREICGKEDADLVVEWLNITEAEPWPEPIDILRAHEPLPEFPREFLSGAFGDRAADVSRRQGSHYDIVAFSLLVATATAGGAFLKCQPKDKDREFRVHCNLWAVIIARSGQLKSPGLNQGLSGIIKIENQYAKQYAADMKDDESRRAREKLMTRAEKRELLDNGTDEHAAIKKRRVHVTNATGEAMAQIMQNTPQGFLYHSDELAGMMKRANQYKSGHGDDVEFLLTGFDGGDIPQNIARATTEGVHVDNCYVSIVGGIQPPIAKKYLINEINQANGFAARFGLMARPDESKVFKYVNEPDDRNVKRTIDDFLIKVRKMTENDDGMTPPRVLIFSAEATALWEKWFVKHQRDNARTPSPLHEQFAKYSGLVARLSTVHYLMGCCERERQLEAHRQACENSKTGTSTVKLDPHWKDYTLEWKLQKVPGSETAKEYVLTMPMESVQAAIDLVENYCRPHARAIYLMLDEDDRLEHGQTIVREMIIEQELESFTVRDVVRCGWAGLNKTDVVEAAFEFLVEMGWLRQVERAGRSGRPTEKFTVNPNH